MPSKKQAKGKAKGKGAATKEATPVAAPAAAERLPNGLERHDASSLTPAEAMAIYKRDNLLWLRLAPADRRKCAAFGLQSLQEQFSQNEKFFTNHFSVENACQHDRQRLTAESIFGSSEESSAVLNSGAFYVSSILQRNKKALATFFASVPFAEPPLLVADHDDGAWLFFGRNPTKPAPAARAGAKRQKTTAAAAAPEPIDGRPEHTDNVTHSGTWHAQLRGTKTWYVRPLKTAEVWEGSPPTLAGKPGAVQGTLAGARLRIVVEEGDLLVINTRVWWHRTEIDPQPDAAPAGGKAKAKGKGKGKAKGAAVGQGENAGSESGAGGQDGLSISYARDFYLEGCARPRGKGKKAAGDDGAAGGGMVFNDADEDDEEDDDEDDENDSEGGVGADFKTNDEALDPRLIAQWMVLTGDVAVDEEDLPEQLPRSRDPNCELVAAEIDGEERVVMLALRDIFIGEPFSIAVEEGDDESDLEEWELDTETGEMTRVLPEE